MHLMISGKSQESSRGKSGKEYECNLLGLKKEEERAMDAVWSPALSLSCQLTPLRALPKQR